MGNTAWAFAMALSVDAPLFTALARAAERRLGDFNTQNLANTAWAFAMACQSDVSLLTALARSAERRAGDFNAQGIVNTAWFDTPPMVFIATEAAHAHARFGQEGLVRMTLWAL